MQFFHSPPPLLDSTNNIPFPQPYKVALALSNETLLQAGEVNWTAFLPFEPMLELLQLVEDSAKG